MIAVQIVELKGVASCCGGLNVQNGQDGAMLEVEWTLVSIAINYSE